MRAALVELAEDEDEREAAKAALDRLVGARSGKYDWLAIERVVGRGDPGVLDALREVGSRILEAERGAGRPQLDQGAETKALTVRLAPRHVAILERLVSEGATNLAAAARLAIERVDERAR